MLNPVAMSIIRNTFEDPRERAHAIGIWAAFLGISIALGPVLGGLVVELSWRVVFLVTVPIGLAAIALTHRVVPESRAARPRRPDLVGQALVVVMLASLTSAIIEGPRLGWASLGTASLVLAAGCALVALVRYELRRDDPLLDLRLFASRPFAAAAVSAVAAFMAFGGFLLNTLYLQNVREISSASAGLYTFRWPGLCHARGAAFRPCRRGAGSARAAGGRRDSAWASAARICSSREPGHIARLAARRVRRLRARFRCGQPADHGLRGNGHASEPGQGSAAAITTTTRQIGATLGVAVVGAVGVAGVEGSIHDHLRQPAIRPGG